MNYETFHLNNELYYHPKAIHFLESLKQKPERLNRMLKLLLKSTVILPTALLPTLCSDVEFVVQHLPQEKENYNTLLIKNVVENFRDAILKIKYLPSFAVDLSAKFRQIFAQELPQDPHVAYFMGLDQHGLTAK